MTQSSPPSRLERVLTDAALQAQFMEARRKDLQDEAQGTKFIYAVDSNVVRSWAEPSRDTKRSRRSRRWKPLGRIFRGDGNDLSAAICLALLTSLIDHVRPPRIPLMVVPPIDIEIRGILEALFHEGMRIEEDADANREIRSKLEAMTAQLSRQLPASKLADINLKLQDILLEQVGPKRALRRLSLLFTRSDVARVEEFRHALPREVAEVLLPSSSLVIQSREVTLAADGVRSGPGPEGGWTGRLRRVGTWRDETLLRNDAAVLGRLEVWNRTLANKGSPWRILYLTADLRLFHAASEHRQSWHMSSFADAFLRHPHAYLSEDGVLGPIDESDKSTKAGKRESVGDWLNLLTQPAKASLSDLVGQGHEEAQAPDAIREFAVGMTVNATQDPGASGDRLASEISRKWNTFAKVALVTGPPSGNSLDGFTTDLRRPVDELVRIVSTAHAELEEDRRRYLREYLRVTTQVGRQFESSKAGGHPIVHAIPPVYFEGWRNGSRAVAVMSQWTQAEVGGGEYQAAVRLLEHDDKTSYAFYLGHAAFFAARGRWRSALLVARRARRIAESFRTTEEFSIKAQGAHGREAAYFEATCLRNLARRSDDLKAARECLDGAWRILRLEQRKGDYPDFVEERFLLEEATIAFAEYVFEALVERREERGLRAFETVVGRLSTVRERLDQILGGVGPEEAKVVGDAVETRLRTELQSLVLTMSLSFMPDARASEVHQADLASMRLESRLEEGFYAMQSLSEMQQAVRLATRLRERRGRSALAIEQEFKSAARRIREADDLQGWQESFLAVMERQSRR